MLFYIADLHFGHRNVIGMEHRTFASIEEMDETLIRLWNKRVTDEDDVYIVGDFAYRNGNTASWYLRQLKGCKHLIGNHDRLIIQDATAMEYFKSVEKMNQISHLRPALHSAGLEIALSFEELFYQEFWDMNHYEGKAYGRKYQDE